MARSVSADSADGVELLEVRCPNAGSEESANKKTRAAGKQNLLVSVG